MACIMRTWLFADPRYCTEPACCSVGETSSIIKTLLGEIFITHGFSGLCGQTRGVERNPDSALSYSHVPPLCLGSSLSSPRDSQSLSLRAEHSLQEVNCLPESISLVTFGNCFEKLSGRHLLGEKLHWRPRVQEDKRGYLCELTQAACAWENILKSTRFEFLHEFHFIYFLSTIARLEWVFIWRYQPGQGWLAQIYPIEHVQPGALSNISLFMVQNSGLMLRPLTLAKPLNSHHISSLCYAGVTQWCFNSAWHGMMSRSLLVTRVSWRMGRKC